MISNKIIYNLKTFIRNLIASREILPLLLEFGKIVALKRKYKTTTSEMFLKGDSLIEG